MYLSNCFPITMYRSIALLALLMPCKVMLAVPLVAFQAVNEPTERKEELQATPDRAGPIPEDAASNAEALLDQGEKSLMDGQYAKAREYFAKAASLNPHDPRSRLSRAFAEFALGDFENAATTAREVMKIAPDLAATPLDMRGLFGDTGIVEEQLVRLDQITQLHTRSSRMQFLLGFVLYFSGERAYGAQALVVYRDANPEDSTLGPFIDIAENVTRSMPQPDERSMAQQPQQEPEPFEAPGPPLQDRPPAPAEAPREFSATGQRDPYNGEHPYSRSPDLPGRATVIQPRRPDPEVRILPASASDSLEEIAVNVFCREEGLDPIDNDVVARVTDEDFDEETGDHEVEVEMHWVEWKNGKHGRGKAKPKNQTIDLRFDGRGRLIEYDD
jgi:tetratricopeptide (TPR) repeat protein